MLQVVYIGVAKIDPDVAHVAMAIHVCCEYLFKMFHPFQTYVASVLFGCCICCNGYVAIVCFLNVSSISDVCCNCFI